MKRHQAQGNSSKEKHLIGDLPIVLEDYFLITMVGSRQTWSWKSSWVCYILIHKLQAQSDRYWQTRVGFWNLRAHPQSYTSSNRPHLLILPQKFHCLWDQAFKQISLSRSFSFKPPLGVSVFVYVWFMYTRQVQMCIQSDKEYDVQLVIDHSQQWLSKSIMEF